MDATRRTRAYLVTLSTFDGRAILEGPRAALFCRVLAASRIRLAFRLHAYVVLPDRVRLILATPDGDASTVPVIVQRVKARFARELHARHGWPGRVFGDAAPVAVLNGATEIERRAEFLHRAPVAAGLARHPRGWTWSSWRAWSAAGEPPAAVDPLIDPPRRPHPARPAFSG